MVGKIDDFDQMMREHLRAVTAYAHSIAPTRDLADEAVQETFIRAWRYSASYRADAPVISWLITICRRVVIDLGQRRSHDQHESLTESIQDSSDSYELSELTDMIASLPLPQREVLVLCAILGFDYETAAHTLSVPAGTVRSRLARARESLSSELDRTLAV